MLHAINIIVETSCKTCDVSHLAQTSKVLVLFYNRVGKNNVCIAKNRNI